MEFEAGRRILEGLYGRLFMRISGNHDARNVHEGVWVIRLGSMSEMVECTFTLPKEVDPYDRYGIRYREGGYRAHSVKPRILTAEEMKLPVTANKRIKYFSTIYQSRGMSLIKDGIAFSRSRCMQPTYINVNRNGFTVGDVIEDIEVVARRSRMMPRNFFVGGPDLNRELMHRVIPNDDWTVIEIDYEGTYRDVPQARVAKPKPKKKLIDPAVEKAKKMQEGKKAFKKMFSTGK